MDALGLTSPQKKLVMWCKVKELKPNGLNYVQIAHEIGLHRQTVMKYDKMTLEAFLSSQAYEREFMRKLGCYEDEVKDELTSKPYLSSRQVFVFPVKADVVTRLANVFHRQDTVA